MRILVGIDRWEQIGGSERYASEVVAGLREGEHEVVVLCAEGEAGAGEQGLELLRFPALAHESLSGSERAELRTLLARVEPERILLLSSGNAPAFRLCLEAAPVVRCVQDHTLFCPGLNKLHADGSPCRSPVGAECLARYWLTEGCSGYRRTGAPSLRFSLGRLGGTLDLIEAHREASALFVASAYMRGELVRAGFPAEQVHVLPYFTRSGSKGGALASLGAELEAFLAEGDAPLLLAAARLTLPDKGIDYLITALGKVQRPCKLVIAGRGPAERWLREKAREEGLGERILFPGWLPADQMEALYARSELVVFPSIWEEPFGLIGLEAMAHGKPIVAFEVGGVSDWLEHEHNGLLAQRGDADALAAAIDRLLGDPELARSLAAAGKQVLARFSRRRHLDELERLLAGS